jgi:ATP synthase protein I
MLKKDDPGASGPLPSLESLQEKIDAVKSQTDKEKQGDSTDGPTGMGDAMKVGVELVSGVAVGSICGFFLDRWLHTMPLFFIVGFFLGAAAGFKNLIREARRNKD